MPRKSMRRTSGAAALAFGAAWAAPKAPAAFSHLARGSTSTPSQREQLGSGAASAAPAATAPLTGSSATAVASAAAAAGAAAAIAASAKRRGQVARAAVPDGAATAIGGSAARSAAVRDASPLARAGVVMEAPTKVSYDVGQKLHGWTCVRVEHIKEFGCSGYLFEHDRTGAELMSMVQPADENKTFGVVFRTPPENSNGIAHVLEHSVLCGSRKYPLKEPFVELLKSSLQTFLNAMTFPDRTCYPVASCNLQDFYNLIDVYLDAVLHPRAVSDPNVLAQEGWHYEIEEKDAPLTYKGVVFNEMKGVYSSPDSAHNRLANQSLFPDNAYGVDSGGDPRVIPSLDFDYLKKFHGKYYHPSNAKFWFYGDDPAERRLELLNEFLCEFDRIEVDSEIKQQPLFTETKRVQGEFAVGEDEDASKKTMVSINWVVTEGKPDAQLNFALSFLNYLLMGTSAAPLYKALVDSGLGSRVIGGGLSDGLLQTTFGVGLKDLKDEDVPKVEELIMKVLTELAESGFKEDEVKAAINTIEFQNRELNTGRFPKGLALMFAAVDNWNYGKDPFEPLRFEEPLAQLKQRIASGEKIFENLITENLLNNRHKVVVESRPNKEFAKKVDDEEKAELEAKRKTLDVEAIEALIKSTKALREIQEKPDDPEAMKTVPRLNLSDIPKEAPKVPSEVFSSSGPTTLVHELPTSGVVYADIAFSLTSVPEELHHLLPLFTSSLRQLGTAKGDFVSLTRRIGMSTGGISASTMCMNKRGSPEPLMYLVIRGKAMAAQVPELTDLIQEIALTVDFDNKERFVQLLRQSKSSLQSALVSSGHVVAAGRLAAQTTKAGWINERWSGLSQFKSLTKLLDDIEAGGWEKVVAQLKSLQACIFNKASCHVINLTTDGGNVTPARAALEAFADALPADATSGPELLKPSLERRAEGIIVPTQVNYVGKGGNLYAAGYELHGSALVVSKLLGTTYLWDRVRVSGGAYGGFCQFDQRSGDFKFLSYRDPNLGETWKTYDGASEFLRELELGEDELGKAIIGCMGDVDAYMLPDAKGYQSMLRHLLGEGDPVRQKVRDEILSTSVEDFRNFAKSLEAVSKSGGLCAIGSKEALEAAQGEFGLELTSPFAAAGAAGAPPA